MSGCFLRLYCVCLLLKAVLKFTSFLIDQVTLIPPSLSVVEKLSGDEKIILMKFTDLLNHHCFWKNGSKEFFDYVETKLQYLL